MSDIVDGGRRPLTRVQRHFTLRHRRLLAKPRQWFGIHALWFPVYWICFTPLDSTPRAGQTLASRWHAGR